ncbi:MAG: hypothetical protein A2139_14220 [Desulfobacca sp. RBG_16_60_12]|nr:MAG: hypothetical protein A2139_14220 [Desulfobacca sp. RBG_16_60_12]
MEPQVLFARVRDSELQQGFPVFDIECRFSDGQKFAAVQVDGQFPELATRIAEFLSSLTQRSAAGRFIRSAGVTC